MNNDLTIFSVVAIRLPDRVMLEITEMMFKSSSSRTNAVANKKKKKKNRNDPNAGGDEMVKLPRGIFLSEPKIIRPYMRMMMHKLSEGSLDGFQMAGCHSQYYNRMMEVLNLSTLCTHFHMESQTYLLPQQVGRPKLLQPLPQGPVCQGLFRAHHPAAHQQPPQQRAEEQPCTLQRQVHQDGQEHCVCGPAQAGALCVSQLHAGLL